MSGILSLTLVAGLAALLAACSTPGRTAPGDQAGSGSSAPRAKAQQLGPGMWPAPKARQLNPGQPEPVQPPSSGGR
jgi:outer membrane protein assembly factor BamE (lipoprotein component of BamABCDE complex)